MGLEWPWERLESLEKMWGCMAWKEVGYSAKIDSRMDGDLYLQILKDKLLNSLEYYGLYPPDTVL
jgi:hypothetical protein